MPPAHVYKTGKVNVKAEHRRGAVEGTDRLRWHHRQRRQGDGFAGFTDSPGIFLHNSEILVLAKVFIGLSIKIQCYESAHNVAVRKSVLLTLTNVIEDQRDRCELEQEHAFVHCVRSKRCILICCDQVLELRCVQGLIITLVLATTGVGEPLIKICDVILDWILSRWKPGGDT